MPIKCSIAQQVRNSLPTKLKLPHFSSKCTFPYVITNYPDMPGTEGFPECGSLSPETGKAQLSYHPTFNFSSCVLCPR